MVSAREKNINRNGVVPHKNEYFHNGCCCSWQIYSLVIVLAKKNKKKKKKRKREIKSWIEPRDRKNTICQRIFIRANNFIFNVTKLYSSILIIYLYFSNIFFLEIKNRLDIYEFIQFWLHSLWRSGKCFSKISTLKEKNRSRPCWYNWRAFFEYTNRDNDINIH